MSGTNTGRVAIVTGAGRGIGRAEAMTLAAEGASVVVNDVGGAADGSGSDAGPASEVVAEIRALGGKAVANTDDISEWDGAQNLINTAVEEFGRLVVLVNNAGILRDRMIVNMSIEEFDAVVKVHLRGTFCTSRWAAAYWREQVKAGETVDGRIINTTSSSGIYGNVGQSNYGAAKAGIAAMTIILSKELGRYGVTVNALAPAAATRLTAPGGAGELSEEMQASLDPQWVANVTAWLASPAAAGVTGRVIDVSGVRIAIAEGWNRGPEAPTPADIAGVGATIEELLKTAAPVSEMPGL
ncbi:MAG: putative oxidoreductase [Actinomycetia bacterium]|nr:putative oxidoreductase [Actinomycetes bacterium]